MNKLLALADRVEKLTGPDDDIFREAFDACFPKPERVWEDEGRECWSTEYENHHNLSWRFESFLEVGAYLDAAMLLVPEKWGWQLSKTGVAGAWLISDGQQPITVGGITFPGVTAQVRAEAISPALALTSAALRARAHGGGEG